MLLGDPAGRGILVRRKLAIFRYSRIAKGDERDGSPREREREREREMEKRTVLRAN